MTTTENVGYIGLGAMGGGMTGSLLRHGTTLTVFDISRERVARLAALGATPAASVAELVSRCSIVFTSLPGEPEVERVYLAEDGIVAAAPSGLLAVDMSTIPPWLPRRIGEALQGRGATMMDAPVARTKAAAENGTLTIMAGGSAADYERVLPYLQMMGTSITRVGELGSGSAAKLVNNAVLMINIVALCEGLVVGAKHGVDPAQLAGVLSDGSADSFALRNHVLGSVLPGRFEADRFPLTYALKDLRYFLDCASEARVDVPVLESAADAYREASRLGYADEYFTVVARVLDARYGTSISAPGQVGD
jgi:3-hydroxyisobutyrate dehydrogenase-like beta-hydroxyacid dehydrogenase